MENFLENKLCGILSCDENSTCSLDTNFKCQCNQSYTKIGERCYYDNCTNESPCREGFSCQSTIDGFLCICISGL